MYIYMFLSFAFDYIQDTMQDTENYTDFELKTYEDKIKDMKEKNDELYNRYYKLMKFDDQRYSIHTYHSKKDE